MYGWYLPWEWMHTRSAIIDVIETAQQLPHAPWLSTWWTLWQCGHWRRASKFVGSVSVSLDLARNCARNSAACARPLSSTRWMIMAMSASRGDDGICQVGNGQHSGKEKGWNGFNYELETKVPIHTDCATEYHRRSFPQDPFRQIDYNGPK
jgi:hypothetical protein